MQRTAIYAQIDLLLKQCRCCSIKDSLVQEHGNSKSRTELYCNRECDNGKALQELGKQLKSGRETKIPSWWDGSGSDIDADYIVS